MNIGTGGGSAEDGATTWTSVVEFAETLPKVALSTSYGTPALKVAGKLIARLRTEAEGGLLLVCRLDEKQALLSGGSPAFYTTPHYDGYSYIIVDLDLVDRDELREMIVAAWRDKATPTARKQYDGTD